ncbi:MAG TPA: NYN domain-containing protein [Candidatus Elarobacter sp.]|nr:NYN domain-containing protein [Candidatus Elarobacter sp.]
MKKTAVLIDAGFLRMFLPRTGFTEIANIVEAFALACVVKTEGEEMHRVLYYDCPPYAQGPGRFQHPIDPTRTPTSNGYQNFWNSVVSHLKSKAYFAVRLGEVSFDGWAITSKAATEMIAQPRAPIADDFQPVLRQKGVDLRIGLDVALMAKDRLIDRIVVVSGDSDIVPAMKVARREGVQVVLISLDHSVKASLREHADIYRNVDLTAVIASAYPGRLPQHPTPTSRIATSSP